MSAGKRTVLVREKKGIKKGRQPEPPPRNRGISRRPNCTTVWNIPRAPPPHGAHQHAFSFQPHPPPHSFLPSLAKKAI